MKRMLVFIVTAVMCGMLAACDSSQPADGDINIENEEVSPSALDASAAKKTKESKVSTEESKASEEEAKASENKTETDMAVNDTKAMRSAYFAALNDLLNKHIFPDGTDCGSDGPYNMADNKFAVYDVDHDGKEELLVMYSSTYSAGMRGAVFAYDDTAGNLKTELSEFPALTFYDNGIIKADMSHNQGLAGEFWPYSLYQYIPDSDSYQFVGMVDAWDKKFAEADGQSKPFPDHIDRSGTGFVYYIMAEGKYDNTKPVDAADYKEWLGTYMGNASECQIKYMDLTEANISQIIK